jgi:lipopolysaccharide transport system ATP-binding protein
MSWSIQVENLSKSYRLGRGHAAKFDNFYQVVSDMCIGAADRVTGGRAARFLPPRLEARPGEIQSEHMLLAPHQFEGVPEGQFWALKDVSFRVDQGQRVGIIGRNGSGKSTLLKILSRITRPSTGTFRFRGHLISLLEVGTGFHPDLTGRENIFLNAKINGMSDQKIRSVFDQIVDFSEIGVQIDMPIKRYSSGMYMRLAFSVAAFLESDILVVDEVLAVGDAGFQKKCLNKMLQIGNSGRTLLFVSHDMDAVKKICNSAIEISHGCLVSQTPLENPLTAQLGAPSALVAGQQALSTAIADYSQTDEFHAQRRWGLDDAPQTRSKHYAVAAVALHKADHGPADRFTTAQAVDVVIELLNLTAISGCIVRIDVETVTGRMLLSAHTRISAREVGRPGRYRIACHLPAPFFNPGTYRLSISLADEFDPTDSCLIDGAVDLLIDEEPDGLAAAVVNPQASLRPVFEWGVRRA